MRVSRLAVSAKRYRGGSGNSQWQDRDRNGRQGRFKNDLIRLDDVPIKAHENLKPVYIMLYKPAGYLSVFDDDRGRPGLEALVKSDTRALSRRTPRCR